MTKEEIAAGVKAVKEHALRRYNKRHIRWDYIVECWTDDEIAEEIGKHATMRKAFQLFRWRARMYHEQELNARDW
jgi:hypothetical protein